MENFLWNGWVGVKHPLVFGNTHISSWWRGNTWNPFHWHPWCLEHVGLGIPFGTAFVGIFSGMQLAVKTFEGLSWIMKARMWAYTGTSINGFTHFFQDKPARHWYHWLAVSIKYVLLSTPVWIVVLVTSIYGFSTLLGIRSKIDPRNWSHGMNHAQFTLIYHVPHILSALQVSQKSSTCDQSLVSSPYLEDHPS